MTTMMLQFRFKMAIFIGKEKRKTRKMSKKVKTKNKNNKLSHQREQLSIKYLKYLRAKMLLIMKIP